MDLETYESYWEEKFSSVSSRTIKYPNIGKIYLEIQEISEYTYFLGARLMLNMTKIDNMILKSNMYELGLIGFLNDDTGELRYGCIGQKILVHNEILAFDKSRLKSPWRKAKSARK